MLFYIIFILCAALLLFYVTVLFKLTLGLRRLCNGTNRVEYNVSIIVAARNEEKNIENCLKALINQNYPADKFEIIIVDDRSTDATATIVGKFQSAYSNINLIQVEEFKNDIAPKKHALSTGISHAQGEILLFTDADCIPGPNWIKSIISYYEPDVGLVAGFSPLDRAERKGESFRAAPLYGKRWPL